MADEAVQTANTSPPLPPCDLVMQGAITSGIIYPHAINELRKHYSFQGIGGTSSGAVAAVVAAAAEFGRATGGFQRLNTLIAELSEETIIKGGSKKVSKLRNLFQAAPETQPLLDILDATLKVLDSEKGKAALAALKGSPASPADNGNSPQPATHESPLTNAFLRLIRPILPAPLGIVFLIADELVNYTWPQAETPYQPFEEGRKQGYFWGILIGIILAILTTIFVRGLVSLFLPAPEAMPYWLLLIFSGVFLSCVAAWFSRGCFRVIKITRDLFNLLESRLPNNFFGACTGHTVTPDDSEPDGTNLTDWLHNTIQNVADRSLPLTFGELAERKVDQGGKLVKREIDLQLVTTNLSHGIPYLLPNGLSNYLFHEDDMYQLFPRAVVQHMIAHPPDQVLIPRDFLPDGIRSKYHYLPAGPNLPVIFGARLSLSFPVLLSAVPLYTISTQAFERYTEWSQDDYENQEPFAFADGDLQKNWFSDGGLCSNFPIQFFDEWLPSWPTFGVHLTSSVETSVLARKSGEQESTVVDTNDVPVPYLRHANEPQDPIWQGFNGLLPFLWATFTTPKDHHETLQTNLPSYRERIVQIPLTDLEGGLNLTMSKDIIDTLAQKGKQAGQLLTDSDQFNFDHHWWVRFLVLMNLLEQNFAGLQKFPRIAGLNIDQRVQRQVQAFEENNPYPYPRDKEWWDSRQQRVESLLNLVKAWAGTAMTPPTIPIFRDGAQVFVDHAPTPGAALQVIPSQE